MYTIVEFVVMFNNLLPFLSGCFHSSTSEWSVIFNVTLAICVFSLMNVYMMNIHVMLSVVQDDKHMIQYELDM